VPLELPLLLLPPSEPLSDTVPLELPLLLPLELPLELPEELPLLPPELELLPPPPLLLLPHPAPAATATPRATKQNPVSKFLDMRSSSGAGRSKRRPT
jgi:hypothetical protein